MSLIRRQPEIDRSGDLMDLWPTEPWLFGEKLADAAQAIIIPSSPLRADRYFLEGLMRLIIQRAKAAGTEFKPDVDIMVIADGATIAAARESHDSQLGGDRG